MATISELQHSLSQHLERVSEFRSRVWKWGERIRTMKEGIVLRDYSLKGQIVVVFDNATFERDIFRQSQISQMWSNNFSTNMRKKTNWPGTTGPYQRIKFGSKQGVTAYASGCQHSKCKLKGEYLSCFCGQLPLSNEFCIHSSSRSQIFRASWAKNKGIKLFLSGDYGFLQKLYFTAGAQSTHLCLYCCNCTAKNKQQKTDLNIHPACCSDGNTVHCSLAQLWKDNKKYKNAKKENWKTV